MKKEFAFFISLMLSTLSLFSQGVKIYEEPLVIPSYEVKPADPNPIFFRGEVYQGASKVIYPYALIDNLGNGKQDKKYNAVYLENEFIKICVLPELGGKLYDGLDKTNGYHFFYRNNVVKPSNIGMLGAWVSGGIEWCVVHHHRASTFLPVDYSLCENPDGSKTLWFGETEPRHRMRWTIGLTVFPGKSYVEAEVKIINRTPETHTFLYWANVATHANSDYRVIFPASTEFAVYHAKNSFARWPVSHEIYNGVDYTKGVDLSWWKNHPEPISFFAHNLKEDFMGGFDYGKNAGTVHVGNHHVVKGAKLWEWGPSEYAQMWDKVLTDSDGPYAEIMVGAFSDNQPDYSWIRPYEVKTFKQYWYPVRDIGGFRTANLDAAANLEILPGNQLRYGFYVTSPVPGAKISVYAGNQLLAEEKADLDPARSFRKTIKLTQAWKESDCRIVLKNQTGKEVLSYQPTALSDPNPLPPVVEKPAPPQEIRSQEELFLTGQRIRQFYNPTLDPYIYMEEALRRDPSDSRVNTWMGNESRLKADYESAIQYYRSAIGRISKDYTRPANCEAYYGLGLCLKQTGKFEAARDTLYRASWDYAWHSAAYFQLASVSTLLGEYSRALEEVEKALTNHASNQQALALKASLLRHNGNAADAVKLSETMYRNDPLDFRAGFEFLLCLRANGQEEEARNTEIELETKMRGFSWNYLELADDYIQSGFYDEAIDALRMLTIGEAGEVKDPMVFYSLAWLFGKKQDMEKSKEYLETAMDLPSDYCFPYMNGSIPVLKWAADKSPADAKLPLCLGNLFYDKQPEVAMYYWKKAVDVDPGMAVAWRNLGWAAWYTQKDARQAVAFYEKAVQIKKNDPLHYTELDRMYERANEDVGKRLKLLEENISTVQNRDDALLRYIKVLILAGRNKDACDWLMKHHFHVREGDEHVHDVHIDAHLLAGINLMQQKNPKLALEYFKRALEYPENQQAGKPLFDPRWIQAWYFTGKACKESGDLKNANVYFTKAVNDSIPTSMNSFFQGLAFMELKQSGKAEKLFMDLIAEGKGRLGELESENYFAKFGERQTTEEKTASAHFMMAMGYYGLGMHNEAKMELILAKGLYNSQPWYEYFLQTYQEDREN